MNIQGRVRRLENAMPTDYKRALVHWAHDKPPAELNPNTYLVVFEFSDDLDDKDLLPERNDLPPEERNSGQMLAALDELYERCKARENEALN